MNNIEEYWIVLRYILWALFHIIILVFVLHQLLHNRNNIKPLQAITIVSISTTVVAKRILIVVLAFKYYFNNLDAQKYFSLTQFYSYIFDFLLTSLIIMELILLFVQKSKVNM